MLQREKAGLKRKVNGLKKDLEEQIDNTEQDNVSFLWGWKKKERKVLIRSFWNFAEITSE